MKRSVGLLVMIVSLVGSYGCKKAGNESAKKTEPQPIPKVESKESKETPKEDGSANAAPDPWKQEAAKKDPLKAPFFWSAEKDGKTTYFLGTMHMGVEAEQRLPQIVWDKLDAQPTFAMEADLSDPKLASSIIRASGTLKEDLGEEYWKKLEKAVGPAMAAQMERLTPMGAAAMMSLKDLPKTSPMDGVLLGRAINKKKTVVYLEEGAFQAEMLTKHMGTRALKMMIDFYEKAKSQSLAMLDGYTAGDPNAILKLNDEQKADAIKFGYTEKEYAEQMEDILYKRNANWIPALEKLHAAGGGFVAVGALHLIGPKSVLELLEKKGFKITRVKP